ncbi:MAG: ABATE domain-containing protein [Chloroflexota bacterium]
MAIENISLVGGHIALDFVNTVGDHLAEQPREWVKTYADLAIWAVHAGVITQDHAGRLITLAEEQADVAEQALTRAIETREVIFRLLLGVIRKQAPDEVDLAAFNAVLANAPARTRIVHEHEHYHWHFSGENESLDDPLWRIIWAAADLLTADQLSQVKVCEGDQCGWIFLDISRNQARRWCSMANCGNRAKANRYYKRHKDE